VELPQPTILPGLSAAPTPPPTGKAAIYARNPAGAPWMGIEAIYQGSQFTSTDFVKVLAAREIKISMDGKGAWRDNVFVERLWRSIKCEEVYLRAYPSVSEARAGIGRYLTFHNTRRPHSSLDGKTPDQACFNRPMPDTVAA
jgi:transposase InsO family protein